LTRRYRRSSKRLATSGFLAILTAACGHDDATTRTIQAITAI
jgi:hypothetical protein